MLVAVIYRSDRRILRRDDLSRWVEAQAAVQREVAAILALVDRRALGVRIEAVLHPDQPGHVLQGDHAQRQRGVDGSHGSIMQW